MTYTPPYIASTLTVNAVVFQLINRQLHVLLVQQPNAIDTDSWMLPGGANPSDESTLDTLERIVKATTGIAITSDLLYLEQLYTFDVASVGTPHNPTVSVTYMGCGCDIVVRDEPVVAFYPIHALPTLDYDHADVIAYAHRRLIVKLSYTNLAYALMPPVFNLGQLQLAYEAIFGHQFDKRNFRKKLLGLNILHETGMIDREGAHRPAKLYAFNTLALEEFSHNFA
jgi:8-oxo-dGTP diphosphatase